MVRARRRWDQRVPHSCRDGGVGKQQQGRRARLAVLDDVHIAAVEASETVDRGRIGRGMQYHCVAPDIWLMEDNPDGGDADGAANECDAKAHHHPLF
jgi:hypothetical protein